jgi:hypothetical protein
MLQGVRSTVSSSTSDSARSSHGASGGSVGHCRTIAPLTAHTTPITPSASSTCSQKTLDIVRRSGSFFLRDERRRQPRVPQQVKERHHELDDGEHPEIAGR